MLGLSKTSSPSNWITLLAPKVRDEFFNLEILRLDNARTSLDNVKQSKLAQSVGLFVPAAAAAAASYARTAFYSFPVSGRKRGPFRFGLRGWEEPERPTDRCGPRNKTDGWIGRRYRTTSTRPRRAGRRAALTKRLHAHTESSEAFTPSLL